MQTFLPYSNYKASAKVLDDKRLGKQRVENLQIMNAILLPEYGWKNHPATKQWVGHERELLVYHISIVNEWVSRGFEDTTLETVVNLVGDNLNKIHREIPSWVGIEDYHASHRSNLLRKDPVWYGQFGWQEPDDLPYWWPSKEM